MKKLLISLATIVLSYGAAQAEYVKTYASANYLAISPQFDFYDGAYGFEGQLHRLRWRDDTMGYSLVIGIQNWGIASRPPQIVAVEDIRSINGDASFLVAGSSWILRPDLSDRFNVQFELGGRWHYGLTSATTRIPINSQNSVRGGGIDIGAQIVGLGMVSAEIEVNDDWIISLGAGYQVDIVQGEIAYRSSKVADNELGAPIFRLGAVVEF